MKEDQKQWFFVVESLPTLKQERLRVGETTICSGTIRFPDNMVSTSLILDQVESIERDFLRDEIIVTSLNLV